VIRVTAVVISHELLSDKEGMGIPLLAIYTYLAQTTGNRDEDPPLVNTPAPDI
jgi:hypothetical protein